MKWKEDFYCLIEGWSNSEHGKDHFALREWRLRELSVRVVLLYNTSYYSDLNMNAIVGAILEESGKASHQKKGFEIYSSGRLGRLCRVVGKYNEADDEFEMIMESRKLGESE